MHVGWIKLKRFFGFIPSSKGIPEGVYCYEPVEFPSEENGFIYKTRPCPNYKSLKNGNDACLYLGYVGWEPGFSDQCKLCSINNPSHAMEA